MIRFLMSHKIAISFRYLFISAGSWIGSNLSPPLYLSSISLAILSGEIMISYGWVLPAEMMRAYAV